MILYESFKPNPKTGKFPLRGPKIGDITKPVQVPCGKCIGCRLERSRQWAIRCINEAQEHEKTCFITLTYRNEELTYGNEKPTLFPRDFQLFLKRLRKQRGNGIRFFGCGEYGDRYGRPHYHACIFGTDFPDKVQISEKDGIPLYTSAELEKLWPLGFNTVGDLNFETAAYVARYCLKKKTGKKASYYEEEGLIPEFTRMSRRPGIGSSWLKKYQSDVYPHDYMVIRGGIKTRPPRFYDSKFELDNPEKMEYIKQQRQEKALKYQHDNTKKRLRAKEAVKNAQARQLLRNLD